MITEYSSALNLFWEKLQSILSKLIIPPSNSCFFLYAARHVLTKLRIILFELTIELSLEADERFFYKAVSQIEDNNLSGWDVGVVPLMNKSSKYMLSKQVNTNILEKSQNHKKMSLHAVTNLNLIYLYYSSRFQDELIEFKIIFWIRSGQ